MKMRRAHRPARSWVGANSVTAIGGLAALAAVIPGHVPGAPSDQGPAVSAATTTDNVASAQDFRLAEAKLARTRQPSAAMPLYRVRSGDSISAVAVAKCHGQDRDWTGIYAASRKQHLTARNANQLTIGQYLAISCTYLPSQLHFAPAPPPPPPPAPVMQTQATTTSAAAPVHRTYQSLPAGSGGESGLYGAALTSFGRCVIARESGGNSQVMNSSGHYGLYQFSASTWQAYGGSAASFGRASAAEQTAVFNNAIRQGGQSNWSPYDGC